MTGAQRPSRAATALPGIAGKVAIVTGGVHGIGRACVEAFITAADLPVDGGYLGLGSEGLGDSSEYPGKDS